MKVLKLAGLTVFVAFGYVVYYGTRRFLRNEITLNITEVVYLPVCERLLELEEGTVIHGEIECETYLMRSYRFLLKLSANLNGGPSTPPSTVRSRNRVMNVTDSDNCRELAPRFLEKRQKEAPVIFASHTSTVVDEWELVPRGNICFTPACISNELLLGYEASVRNDYRVSASVRNCYVQADETPGLKRLSFELVVYDVIHGAKVCIALPNRYFDVVAIHTGGIGSIQQPDARKPHHILWEIGTVDEESWMKVKSTAPGVLPEGRLARRGFTDDDMAAALESSGAISTVPNTFCLVEPAERQFGQRDDADQSDANSESLRRSKFSGLLEGTQLLVAKFMLVFEEPEGSELDYISSDSDVKKDEEEPCDPEELKRRGGHKHSCVVGLGCSRRSARREERARKMELQQSGGSKAHLAACGVVTRLPFVELTYSVIGLVSGLTVRKLQTVSEQPNWIPRSFIDKWMLWWMIPCIHELRLEKLANYTTWFVQRVSITSL